MTDVDNKFETILTQLTLIEEHTTDIPTWASALIAVCQSLVVEFRLLQGATPRISKLEQYVDMLENEKDKLENEAEELKLRVENIEQRNKDFVIMLAHDMSEEQKSHVTMLWPELVDDISIDIDASQFDFEYVSPIKKHNRTTRHCMSSPRPLIMKFKGADYYKVDDNGSLEDGAVSLEDGEIITIAQPRIMYSEQIEIISFARLVENCPNESEFEVT